MFKLTKMTVKLISLQSFETIKKFLHTLLLTLRATLILGERYS